jgi:pimeloyl-ACP methyl ester carboxylesterase
MVAGIGVWHMPVIWTQEIRERDLFFPRTLPAPADHPERRLVEIPIDPNLSLRGWLLPHPAGGGTLLHAYGNGDTVADSLDRMIWLRDALEVHVLAVDYRGYGFSDGAPSVQALLDDVIRVFDHCREEWIEPGAPVWMYGRSIGTVPAIHLAAHRPLDGLILETPFTDVESVINAWERNLFPLVRWLMRMRPSPELADRRPQPGDLLAAFRGPLLVIHGNRDTVIPIALGRRMFDLCPSNRKTFCEVPGTGHNDLWLDRPPASDALRRFVRFGPR